MANGVPVVQPRHGSFPEWIEATGGGVLVEPENPIELARGLRELMVAPDARVEFGRKGKEAVHTRFHAAAMAEQTAAVYQRFV
jgi:glycosyltransferase involved in cell wall biosynthesis